MTITVLAATQIIRLQGGGLRFLDAHEISQKDFQVVTRPFQSLDTTQQWRFTDRGDGLSTIQQVSSGRFLEATLDGDFKVVTEPVGNSEQTWRIGDP
jgi:hypothetical protein